MGEARERVRGEAEDEGEGRAVKFYERYWAFVQRTGVTPTLQKRT